MSENDNKEILPQKLGDRRVETHKNRFFPSFRISQNNVYFLSLFDRAFPSCRLPVFQNESKHSYETEPRIQVHFHVNSNSFSFERFFTRICFETEAQGNSEIASLICYVTHFFVTMPVCHALRSTVRPQNILVQAEWKLQAQLAKTWNKNSENSYGLSQ